MAARVISPEELKSLYEHRNVLVLDVRRKAAYEQDKAMIPNAIWRDPEQLQGWSAALPKDKEIVVYCVHGQSVSNAVIDHLQQCGFSARYLEGGIEAWKESGGALISK